MKKRAFFICVSIMVTLVIFVSAYSQEDMVIINSDGFDSPRRPPAVFRHDEHNEAAEIEDCNQCHHVYDDDGKLIDITSYDIADLDRSQWLNAGKEMEGKEGDKFYGGYLDDVGAEGLEEYIVSKTVYKGEKGVIGSKRWDAWRQGIADFEYVRMLTDAVTDARRAGITEDVCDKAERLLTDGVNEVVGDSAHGGERAKRESPDRLRIEILRVLTEFGSLR